MILKMLENNKTDNEPFPNKERSSVATQLYKGYICELSQAQRGVQSNRTPQRGGEQAAQHRALSSIKHSRDHAFIVFKLGGLTMEGSLEICAQTKIALCLEAQRENKAAHDKFPSIGALPRENGPGLGPSARPIF